MLLFFLKLIISVEKGMGRFNNNGKSTNEMKLNQIVVPFIAIIAILATLFYFMLQKSMKKDTLPNLHED